MKSLTAALIVLLPAAAAFAQSEPEAEALIQKLDKTEAVRGRDKPFEVALSLGRLYYGNGRFTDAIVFLGESLQKSEPLRKLYLDARPKAPAALPEAATECTGTEPLEQKHEFAKKRMQSRDVAGAAACALAALQPALEGEQMLANARFLTGDAPGALAALERVLQVAPQNPEALYAHASVLFETKPDDVKALGKAKSEWEQALKAAPASPRAAMTRRLIARAEEAIAAGGVAALDKKQAPLTGGAPVGNASPPPLSQETMQAFQNAEVTAEMTERFGKLIEEGEEHLARGRFQQALDNYKQVMPYQPQNPRLRAGMAWALVALNRQPMADRVWQVAVSSDPASVEALGATLKARGDAGGARSVWAKLAETDPSYAQKAGLRTRLENP